MPSAPAVATVAIVSAVTGLPCAPLFFTHNRPTDPATIALAVRIKDQYGAPFVDTVTWSSGRPDIATVLDGVVTPVVAEGTCNIIATSVSDPTISAAVQCDIAARRDGVS